MVVDNLIVSSVEAVTSIPLYISFGFVNEIARSSGRSLKGRRLSFHKKKKTEWNIHALFDRCLQGFCRGRN